MPTRGGTLSRARDRRPACALAPAPRAADSSCAGAETRGPPSGHRRARAERALPDQRAARRSRDRAGLRANPKLALAAARHSSDMVQNGFFSHTSPGGATFIDRIRATGYMRGARSWLVGENLVWGSGDPQHAGQRWSTAWMDSPPHRANLLAARFREIGVSTVRRHPERRRRPRRRSRSPRSSATGTSKKKKQARRQGRRGAGPQRSFATQRSRARCDVEVRSGSGKPFSSPLRSARSAAARVRRASAIDSVTSTSPPRARVTTRWARLTSPPK